MRLTRFVRFRNFIKPANSIVISMLLFALAFGMTACKEKDLKQIANWGNTITSSMEEFEDLAIKFNQQGRLTDGETGSVLVKVLEINNTMQVAKNTIVRIQNRKKAGGDGMTSDERLALSDLFLVIRDTALDLEQLDLLGIEDENARASLRVVLSIALTTLASITDLLVAQGG